MPRITVRRLLTPTGTDAPQAAGKRSRKPSAFPDDYDGIISGDPDFYATHIQAAQLFIGLAVHKDDASYIPPAKYPALHSAALQACDALDGVKDGVIEDPTRCHFDPQVLLCKDADGPGV